MEKYMGYRARETAQGAETLLPEINIAGTLFHADINRLEFRQVDDPSNRMPMIGVKEEMGFSHFFYDTLAKNHYAGDTQKPGGIPEHVRIVLLPPLKDLDPVGFARKRGLPDQFYGRRQKSAMKLQAIGKLTPSENQARPVNEKRKGKSCKHHP